MLLVALCVREESRTAAHPLAGRLVSAAAPRVPCGRPVRGGGLRRGFPFHRWAACTSPRSPRSRSAPPPCWRSCLCSCAARQMGEVILAGKKNMLLFAGCFNVGVFFFFFSQPDQFPDPVRRAGTESCAWAAAGQQDGWAKSLCPKCFVPLEIHSWDWCCHLIKIYSDTQESNLPPNFSFFPTWAFLAPAAAHAWRCSSGQAGEGRNRLANTLGWKIPLYPVGSSSARSATLILFLAELHKPFTQQQGGQHREGKEALSLCLLFPTRCVSHCVNQKYRRLLKRWKYCLLTTIMQYFHRLPSFAKTWDIGKML